MFDGEPDLGRRANGVAAFDTRPLVLPEPLLVEIGYMLGSRASASAEADFLRDVADGLYTVESIFRWCVGALAERLGITRVATLDTRHFPVVKPRHISAFTLLP
ncbi:DNA-binding protein [Amycolatopsis sp. WGS_07]|uniref:DNA-binding protein n=1 Tax=Amycolatopsis sp. WGS_07 TaxID=3076764 RepID=UPI003873AF9D